MSKSKITARKRFGQNFLQDQNMIAKIIRAINIQPTDHIVEIGPGRGALTDHIATTNPKQLDIIEIDRDLGERLQQAFADKSNIRLILGDALELNFSEFGKRLRIVGNLPYNISTPLLFHVLQSIDHIADMHFMLQKEVVDRMVANVGEHDYSRLTVMLNYFCDCKRLFNVPPTVFYPKPKVMSSFVRLLPKPNRENINLHCFESIVRDAFNHRRKTIRNSLQTWFDEATLQELGFDPKARAQQLSYRDYVKLSQNVDKTWQVML